MATYKVIQDIEAEDKLLGPLTLRQFIYAGITVFFGYLCFLSISKGAAFLVVLFAPPMFGAAFFAFPWSREQSTEVWALARIRFMFKPRKRIWNQSGIKELVTVTAPKKIEQVYTNGLTQTEVKSRLQALAATIDSRGWAIKNGAMPGGPTYAYATATSDRLVDARSAPKEVPQLGNEVYTDMLDTSQNQVAQQFDSMLHAQAQAHRQQLVAQLQSDAPMPAPAQMATPVPPATVSSGQAAQNPPADYWFLNQTAAQPAPGAATFPSQVVAPGTDPSIMAPATTRDEEAALTEQLRAQAEAAGPVLEYAHLPTILPIEEQQKQAQDTAAVTPNVQDPQHSQPQPAAPVTAQPDAAILDLARNDDLDVATLARQANKAKKPTNDEVVISLH